MKKAAFLKLLEKFPANEEVKFVLKGDHYYTVRLEIEDNYDVIESVYDEKNDVDVPVPPRVEKTRYVRLEIE